MSSRIIDASKASGLQPLDWGAPPPGPRRASEQHVDSTGLAAAPASEAAIQAEYERGYAAGEAAFRQALQGQVEALEQRVCRSLEEIAALRPRLRHQAEAQVVELALRIARKILGRQIQIDSEVLTGLLKAALDRIDARELFEVRVAPRSQAAIQASIQHAGLPVRVQVVADASLEPGALLLETDRGRLDASIDTQLEEIERGFSDYLALGGGR